MQQRVSFMTGFQSGINEEGGPLLLDTDHDAADADGFRFGEQNNTDKSYTSRRTDHQAKHTIKPIKPAHHLFDLLESEFFNGQRPQVLTMSNATTLNPRQNPYY